MPSMRIKCRVKPQQTSFVWRHFDKAVDVFFSLSLSFDVVSDSLIQVSRLFISLLWYSDATGIPISHLPVSSAVGLLPSALKICITLLNKFYLCYRRAMFLVRAIPYRLCTNTTNTTNNGHKFDLMMKFSCILILTDQYSARTRLWLATLVILQKVINLCQLSWYSHV